MCEVIRAIMSYFVTSSTSGDIELITQSSYSLDFFNASFSTCFIEPLVIPMSSLQMHFFDPLVD